MTLKQGATHSADCCIVGAGPAGLMLAYLLVRAGLRVTVIEKHADFLRDFRGDTIHPSTLEIMHQLGLLEALLTLPHQRVEKLEAEIGGQKITMADFSRLPVTCRFIAFMPQWDFLTFLAEKAAAFPGFTLMQSTRFEQLVYDGNVLSGVEVKHGSDTLTVRTRLVIGADGRHSRVRDAAGFTSQSFGAPRDVVWFRLSKQSGDPLLGVGHNGPKQNMILIDRDDYWQCGYSIEKGQFDVLKAAGLPAFKAALAEALPFKPERLEEVDEWDKLKLLSIRIDRLDAWMKPGILCIGDAAHAMSPIGGVGVNLAIQDAVAAANVLIRPLQRGEVTLRDLQRVQKRRQFPTVATQFLQIKMSGRKRQGRPSGKMPKMIGRMPFLRHLFGRLIGLGFRTERPKYLK